MKEILRKKIVRIVAAIIGIAVLAVMIGAGVDSYQRNSKIALHLEAGSKFLENLDYGQAITEYKAALAIDPRNEDIIEFLEEAYLASAQIQAEAEEYILAADILQKGYEQTQRIILNEKCVEMRELQAKKEERMEEEKKQEEEKKKQEEEKKKQEEEKREAEEEKKKQEEDERKKKEQKKQEGILSENYKKKAMEYVMAVDSWYDIDRVSIQKNEEEWTVRIDASISGVDHYFFTINKNNGKGIVSRFFSSWDLEGTEQVNETDFYGIVGSEVDFG